LTIATAGPEAKTAAMSASMAAFWSAGSFSILPRRSPKPLLRSTPREARTAACFVKRSLKKTRDA